MVWSLLLIAVGLAVLVFGGDLLVRGASQLALSINISPLVIGLTVVAFGTSAPELAVSLQAAFSGQAAVAVGNVLGSNIFNVLCILGLSATVTPLVVSSQLVRWDVPFMILSSLLMWWMSIDMTISQLEGGVLFAILCGFIVSCLRRSRLGTGESVDETAKELPSNQGKSANRWAQMLFILLGLVLLAIGSKWLVNGAVTIATIWGVSDLIIGLTIVAAGTSLPEVVTSVVASIRGERDIAVGNVVGSNIFNLLCVLGLSSLISPAGIPLTSVALQFDIPVMVAVAILCLPICFTNNLISRFEGAILLLYYLAYILILILAEAAPELGDRLETIVAFGLIPLTVLTLLASLLFTWRVSSKGLLH
ncbi:MAG: calcium/sodium antiporter [Planctomycetales bacterium]|nr:calcium/sodium antiporter [Planctomycetales bacterium]